MNFDIILVYIGIFIFYTTIMKIHIYKWPMDKIPLNAVPFYKNDTMEIYEDAEETYKRKKVPIEERFDLNAIQRIDNKLDERSEDGLKYVYGEEYVNWLKQALKLGPCYIIPEKNNEDANIDIYTYEKGDKTLIVYNTMIVGSVWNYSLKEYFKVCNKFFKDLWYTTIAYHFPVAHCLKPDICREDYDTVYRLWATDDYMGYRVYVKKF